MPNFTIREAFKKDATNIGLLHALSWMNTYKNILPDSFLNNDLAEERKKYWSERLSNLTSKDFVFVAEMETDLVGFIAVFDEPDREYKAFIDNLHVHIHKKGMGIGKKLMKAAAGRLREMGINSAYLWVLKGNNKAEEFYKAIGAKQGDTSSAKFGDATILETRFVWDNLDELLNSMI